MITPSPLPEAITPVVDHRANLTMGVLVPLLQALISGFFAAILVGVVAVLLGFRPWKPAATFGILMVCISWVFLVGRWVNVVHFIEKVTDRDIDQDGYVGDTPTQPVDEIRIVVQDRPGHLRIATFPTTRAKLIRLCKGLLGGMPFTERAWAGGRRPFSQDEFFQVREVGLRPDVGYWVWINDEHHQQGCVPTELGWIVIKQIAKEGDRVLPAPPEGFEPINR